MKFDELLKEGVIDVFSTENRVEFVSQRYVLDRRVDEKLNEVGA